MMSLYKAEKTYRAWSSPILLALKEREDELDRNARQALDNVLAERRLIDSGNPSDIERRRPIS